MTEASRKFVVIADDYDSAAEILAQLVELSTAYETVYAKDGAEALDQARRRRPDACVFDIDMPSIGGIEAAKTLQDQFGENRPLLIAMTGASLDDARRSGLFDHALQKPVDLDDLLQKLREA